MQLKFNTYGNDKQKECVRAWCDDETTDIVYGGAKGGGKSYLGCSLIFGDALMYPGTRYFIARKKLTDLRKHTIPSIHEVFVDWGLDFDDYVKFNGQDNTFIFKNGSSVLFIDAKYVPSDPNYTRFGSMQMTRGWIEEAGEFESECTRNLVVSCGRWKNDKYGLLRKTLQTCNPNKGYLYDDYYLPNKKGELISHKKFIQALPRDNKKLTAGYLEHLENTLSPNEKERLLHGNWEYEDNPNALFEYEDILNLYTNEIKYESDEYITADIAYTGADKFVLGYWKGLVLNDVFAIDKIDQTMVSKVIHDFRFKDVSGQPKRRVPIKNVIYDADGLKMFVRQSAKTGNLAGATQFHNGARPLKIKGQIENFSNLKTQCAFKLAELVRNGEMKIETFDYRDEIIQEFQKILKKPMKDDEKVSLISKDDMRKLLNRSPDFWDMINMRMLTLINKSLFRDKSWATVF